MAEPRWIEALNGAHGGRLALVVVALVSAVLFFGNLGRIGIWEPWEANEIFVATEYKTRGEAKPVVDPSATSWNWAVPTYEQRPVARPLLKTWLVGLGAGSQGELKVGALEFKARLPIALVVWGFLLAGAAWVCRRFDAGSALVTGLVFATFPVVFMGVHNLATEMLFLATTSLALIAWFEFHQATTRRWAWALGLGAALSLAFLDQRLLGIYLVLVVMAAHAVTELVYESQVSEQKLVGKTEVGLLAASVAGILAMFGVGYAQSSGWEGSDMFRPHVLQWFATLLPLLLVLGGLGVARQTRAGRAFFSPPMAVALLMPVLTLVVVAYAYGEANPMLTKNGELFSTIPVLKFLLENHVFGQSLAAKHMSFDLWLRQVAFAMVTWVGLAPLAVGYLARASRADVDEKKQVQASAKRFLLVWIAFSAAVMMAASVYGHHFYPGYFAFAAGIGLMLMDREFWGELRKQPLVLYAMGFLAVALVLMVGKDLERFPARFVEVFTVMQEKLELKDDFSFGKLMKAIKYGQMLILIAHFFGVVSFVGLVWSRRRAFWGALRHPITWVRGWLGSTPEQNAFDDEAAQKEAFRAQPGWLSGLARFVETPHGFPLILVAAGLVSVGVYMVKFIPEITNHMSQRGVFETFVRSAGEGGQLLRYDVATRDRSVYLQDVETVASPLEFRKKFEATERMYAVIPRGNLARINHELRKETRKNLVVLDARSNRLLLVSNQLGAGETDHNYVAEHIIDDVSKVPHALTFDDGGKKVHPQFDGQLEFIGYGFDHTPGADGMPSYRWGETAVVDYYFRVLKRVPGNQKIFLHADTPGNRISGDHYPNDGEFPTNYWLEGDIVRARHHLKIEEYSSPGVYTLNFGFFIGSKRMAVTPRAAHDGGNRVPVAKIRVTSL